MKNVAHELNQSHIAGFERLSAFTDLLDQINVFPIADGDTGTNLRLSLACLRQLNKREKEDVIHQLLLSARGNSGNIAASFFSGFLTADSEADLAAAAQKGRTLAWGAVNNPQGGTMLSVFDALVETLGDNGAVEVEKTLARLQDTVKATPRFLPRLQQAGVVDSGALGMLIYFEAFFHTLFGQPEEYGNVFENFAGSLEISPTFREENGAGYCIDVVVKTDENFGETAAALSQVGDDLVLIPDQDFLKIHIHTHDREAVKRQTQLLGPIVRWSDDDLAAQVRNAPRAVQQAIHVMTDRAGSVTSQDARALGITLLDGYVNTEGDSLPESSCDPAELYRLMKNGVRVSTSQAALLERYQCYRRTVDQYGRVLYLCVGPFFTDNCAVAAQWKEKNDPENRLVLINTTAASGRLGLIAIATARRAMQERDPEAVIAFAHSAVAACKEYIFMDTLKYLAAGGRLARMGAFFGDALRIKPIIGQTPKGIKQVGLVQDRQAQLAFALDKLGECTATHPKALVMIEYSDNQPWVEQVAAREIKERCPAVEILVRPLSMTSGIHLGPGTWAIGILPNVE